jgi:hypothetical protein
MRSGYVYVRGLYNFGGLEALKMLNDGGAGVSMLTASNTWQ